jgi:hypothetical protein
LSLIEKGIDIVIKKVGGNGEAITIPFENFTDISPIMQVGEKWGFVVCDLQKKIPFSFATKEMAELSMSNITSTMDRAFIDFKKQFPNKIY